MVKKSVGTPATLAADKARIAYTVHAYEHDPNAASFGLEAAEALGIEPERVYKTLLVDTGDGLAVAVVPVDHQLDLKAAAHALGVKKVAMAKSADAERSSGMVVGGISPLGQKKRLPTFLDASMRRFEQVLVSGGRRGLDIELSPDDLAKVTGGDFVELAR